MRRLTFLSVLLLLLATQIGYSQSTKGAIAGRVTDTAGAILQGAHIQITQTGGSLTSDKQGEFLITNLAPGV